VQEKPGAVERQFPRLATTSPPPSLPPKTRKLLSAVTSEAGNQPEARSQQQLPAAATAYAPESAAVSTADHNTKGEQLSFGDESDGSLRAVNTTGLGKSFCL
jgi:hypothetical protein